MTEPVDPSLVAGWLAGRSISRGVPLPVPDQGGWRVDTASDEERYRYVFSKIGDGLRRLGETVDDPRIPLKLCDTADALRALLPDRWTIGAPCFLMTVDAMVSGKASLPQSYRAGLKRRDGLCSIHIVAPDGSLAASGYVALWNGFRVFDRIVTEEAHRRRGLGRAMMTMLASETADDTARSVLVATQAGAALYATLGWTIRSPYTTAAIQP